ncbi:MAG: hypothetical protein H0V66_03145 [Bdellovibrionales bacterium]|nr:hypothetical protein [Bdellovibrionales bacterium]
MKSLIIGSLLFSTAGFAQTIDLNGLKSLMTARKATLEKVNAGMTKKSITTAKEGDCGYMLTSIQSVLKIEGAKIIVLAKEKFSPQNSPACRAAGYTASTEESMLYFSPKPSIALDFEALDATAIDLRGIVRAGEIVTVNLANATDSVSMKYDLAKPSFKNLLLTQGLTYKTVTEDMADIDLKTVNLTKVLFCDDNDGDTSECTEGDYSDILY